MGRIEIRTDFAADAVAVAAGAGYALLAAGFMAEIGRRAADVVDVALEAGGMGHGLGFLQDRRVRTGLDDAALMERQRAEAARAEAAAAGGQAEFDLADRRDAAELFVRRMIGPAVGKTVDVIHLLLAQGLLRRVLHDEFALGIRLDEPLGAEGVGIAVLDGEALGVGAGVFLDLGIGREDDGGDGIVDGAGLVDGPVDVRDVLHVHAVVERVRDLHHGTLAHAVDQKIGLRIEQDRALALVRPVVVVRQPAQARLDAADDDGLAAIGPADEIAVDRHGIVGPLAHDATGGIGVGLPVGLGDGIVVDHRVHIPAHDQKAQAGFAESVDGGGVLPVRLGEDADLIPCVLQHARDDRMAERGVVDVAVADDIDEIALVPAAPGHIGTGDR